MLGKPAPSLLDPIDRISEVLFGLIMVLTSTSTLSVATAGRAEVGTMIMGALGCNLAWGIIDAALYLMGSLEERGRNLLMLRAVRQAGSAEEARRLMTAELPESLASVLSQGEADSLRQKLLLLAEPPAHPGLTKDDALRAAAICLWVFASTFPVVVPFLFIGEVQPALRLSNAIAIVMLFLTGWAFGRCAGYHPWRMGVVMVVVGGALVVLTIALGG